VREYPAPDLAFRDPHQWVFPAVLAERARTHGDRPFLELVGGPRLSYAETDRRVNRLAHGLRAQGVQRGDRVLAMLPNGLEMMLVWWAVNRLGAILVPVNTAYKGYFLEHVVTDSGGRLLVAGAEFLEPLAASEERLGDLETVVVHDPGDAGPAAALRRLRTLPFGALESRRDDPPGEEVSHRDLCAIIYTSGTTGPSKGVMMPHAHAHYTAEGTAHLTRLTEADAYFVATPLSHANAPLMQVYPALLRGGRAVICPRFSASEWLDQIRAAGATATNLLGVMMEFVFRQPPRPDDRDHRLRVVLGQPAPAAIAEAFRRRFGIERVLEYYGMTEIGIVTMTPWDGARPGSCGVAVADWYELRIADPETDEPLPPGRVGELLVRPRIPFAFNQGYWRMPDRTLEALRNVWYHTGDALRRDADGYYYFVDRMRDVIRRRAENIAPYDLERVVAEHPDVAECAAVAVPSDLPGGEDEVKLALVLREGAALDPEAFLGWCEARLPYFAVPRFLEVLPALPRTPSNKVQKYLLRQPAVTPATWDRVAAGYRLREEIARAEARRARAGARDPGGVR
jgi:crotonobetaine/carnitine-CoA ligase